MRLTPKLHQTVEADSRYQRSLSLSLSLSVQYAFEDDFGLGVLSKQRRGVLSTIKSRPGNAGWAVR